MTQPANNDARFSDHDVQPVYVESQPVAIGRKVDILLDTTYTNQGASFSEGAGPFDMSPYVRAQVFVFIHAITGTGASLQLDTVAYTDDGADSLDFYNSGAKTASFNYDIGTQANVNHFVPKRLGLNYVIAGTAPSVSFRVVVYGMTE